MLVITFEDIILIVDPPVGVPENVLIKQIIPPRY